MRSQMHCTAKRQTQKLLAIGQASPRAPNTHRHRKTDDESGEKNRVAAQKSMAKLVYFVASHVPLIVESEFGDKEKRSVAIILFQTVLASRSGVSCVCAALSTDSNALHSISAILQFCSNWHRDRHDARAAPATTHQEKIGGKIEIRSFWRAVSQFTIASQRHGRIFCANISLVFNLVDVGVCAPASDAIGRCSPLLFLVAHLFPSPFHSSWQQPSLQTP